MTTQIQVLSLPSRVVRLAVPVTFGCFGFLIAAAFGFSMTLVGWAVGTLYLLVSGTVVWMELRSPRLIILRDGAVELRSALGPVVINDGELESLTVAFLARVHPWAPAGRVVVRFRKGRRTFGTAFPEYPALVKEFRARNPRAAVMTDVHRAAPG